MACIFCDGKFLSIFDIKNLVEILRIPSNYWFSLQISIISSQIVDISAIPLIWSYICFWLHSFSHARWLWSRESPDWKKHWWLMTCLGLPYLICEVTSNARYALLYKKRRNKTSLFLLFLFTYGMPKEQDVARFYSGKDFFVPIEPRVAYNNIISTLSPVRKDISWNHNNIFT